MNQKTISLGRKVMRASITMLALMLGGFAVLTLTLTMRAQQGSGPKAIVRHGFTLNGRIEGSVQQLTGENTTLNGGGTITGDLLVPGTPTVRQNGHPSFGGVAQGSGNAQPANYQITLNGNAQLGRLLTRKDAIMIPAVAAPPQPTGTRNVVLNSAGQSAGDFATVRDLTLNGQAGMVSVPAGTYGRFTSNGSSGFIFGVAGASQPSVYNLNSLTLNGNSQLRVVGPVVLTMASALTINGTMGAASNPLWLDLRIATGGVTLNGGATLNGIVNAPTGTVTINGNSTLVGNVSCDRLTVNGNGVLRLVQGDTRPPLITIEQPLDGAITNATQVSVTGTYSDDSAATITVNGVAATLSGNSFSAVVPVNEGANTLNVVGVDAVGNRTEITRAVSRDTVAPVITITDPSAPLITSATQIVVKGTYTDTSPTTIKVNGVTATLDGVNFTASVPLNEGNNSLRVVANDAPGNQTELSQGVTRDTTAPLLTVEQPAEGAVVTEQLLTVTGTFNDSTQTVVSINDDLNLVPLISGNRFNAVVPLTEGTNRLTIRAIDKVGNRSEVARTITYRIDHTPPTLTLAEPSDAAVLKTLVIAGSATGPNQPINVSANDHPMAIGAGGAFSGGLDLAEGVGQVRVLATDANGNQTEITRSVTIDTTAPVVTGLSPATGTLINAQSASLQGHVADATTVTVTVNGVVASAGAGGNFTAQNVPIAEGENQIVVVATDAAGNMTESNLLLIGKDVTSPAAPEVFPVTSPTRLAFQTIEGRAEPGSQVTITGGVEPVTVSAAFGTGLFASNINLAVGVNTLMVKVVDASGNGSPAVQLPVTSDPALPLPAGQPAQINVSSGNAQRGLAGTELPRPLIAIVTDSTGAALSGVAVQFVLAEGGGRFTGGATTAEAATDEHGRASVRYVTGAEPGIHLIRANFTGNTSTLAIFTAEGLVSIPNSATTVSGVVQDQNLRALPNVLVRIGGQETRTGADGRFTVGNVPTGPHQLLELIGRDQITLPGRWPNISYDFDVLPGVDNDLGRPLFLPKVNDGIALPLDANSIVTRDTSFELPVIGGEPPIRVTARAGTRVTFPPDVTDKRLSVTQIATNRTPMVLEDGRATNLYISVQPSGAIFERPLEVSFPNVDRLAPNSEVLLMSFDHDAGRYLKVGTGHVSADGRRVDSDPGSGIRVGAWAALPPDPPQPEVTVLGHIQFEGNPAFEDRLVRVNEAWVEGTRAVLTTEGDLQKAPHWDYRATFSVPPGTSRAVKMEASIVTSEYSLEVKPPVPPGGAGAAPAALKGKNSSSASLAAAAAAATQLKLAIAVGQSIDIEANGTPPPGQGEKSYSYSWESDDTSIATVALAQGTSDQTHPTKGTIKGVAPGKTTVTVSYSLKCRNCWVSGSASRDITVTVIGANSLEAQLASTKNVVTGAAPAPGRFSTTSKDLAYVTSSASDLMVVMQNAGDVTVKAVGLNPTGTDMIRWQFERNPDDTVAAGEPSYNTNAGEQFTFTPDTPGSFRLICFVNSYDNNTHKEGQELRVLHLAIVRLTPRPGDSFIETTVSYSDNVMAANLLRVQAFDAMNIRATIIVEGGGADRMIGVAQTQLADVGNAMGDDIVVTYPVPVPTPAPPGNVVGTGTEAPGARFPLVDSLTANPTAHQFIRSHSNMSAVGSGTNGGQVVVIEAQDAPAVDLKMRHPTTTNPWGQIRGGNNFRETIIAYTTSFQQNFVAVARGDWRVTFDGDHTGGAWQPRGANVFLQGGGSRRAGLTIFTQQPADGAGLQIFGPSFISVISTAGGLVYAP